MFPRFCAGLLLSLASGLPAQNFSTPEKFHLVLPHGPGAIQVDASGGWQIDRFALTDNGKRPILQFHNDKLGIIASCILDHDPPYYETSEACRNDILGSIMENALSKATVKDKQSDQRTLATGQTLLIGSYLVAKVDGMAINEKNIFGFIAHDHTCATIHLSRMSFKAGEEHLFDQMLNSFHYDPDYVPTHDDYVLMAKMLPPDMAANYGGNATPAGDSTALAVPDSAGQSLTFALPNHPGSLHMDAPNFAITELSAKPNGHEFGIRADAPKMGGTEILGFLFLPEPAQPNAVTCREWMLNSEKKDHEYRKILNKSERKSDSGVDIAVVDYEQSKTPDPHQFVRRLFVAQGDLCADIEVIAPSEFIAKTAEATINSLTFDPSRPPDFYSTFRYAQVIFDHHNPAAAAPIYESAIPLAYRTDKPLQWRRIATDQASMSYGMAGDLKHSRDINLAAITKDPDYPLYYYNLACADAESGDASAARTHLQQAFDRRANTLPGEKMPDPATDDSILKLKKNKDFWAFVQLLPKN